jgi:adenosylmethionine-8-amino-7-oxononanoate aminotransferase
MTASSPVWHPFTQHAVQPDATLIAKGTGAWLETADGRRIFDAISSWWVVTHGRRGSNTYFFLIADRPRWRSR